MKIEHSSQFKVYPWNYFKKCPKCTRDHINVEAKMCYGKTEGFFKPKQLCPNFEHFHKRCDRCEWKFLSFPADYEEQ